MAVDVLVGLQWGDEGKGKIVDYFAPQYDIVARFQGGPNAGHTLVINGKKYVLHTIPSGIIHTKTINVIGTGTVIDPVTLTKEIDILAQENISVEGRLLVSDKAHLILPTHKFLDKYYEISKGENKIGSTLRGIGPTYQDKYARTGLRVGHLADKNEFKALYEELKAFHLMILKSLSFDELDALKEEETIFFDKLSIFDSLKICEIENFLNDELIKGSSILAEGAQGTLLDVTFGSYPFVTSSNTVSASACIGLGVAPQKIKRVIGVFKAYMTRVGSGPFPTELKNEIGHNIMTFGNEYGATTGRERRCGWLDLKLLKHSVIQNGVTDLVMTKADILENFSDFKVIDIEGKEHTFKVWDNSITKCDGYDDLPEEFTKFTKFITEQTSVAVNIVSTGPERKQILIKK